MKAIIDALASAGKPLIDIFEGMMEKNYLIYVGIFLFFLVGAGLFIIIGKAFNLI